MESEISQVKLIVKNMVLRSPRTSFMRMRFKKPNCLLPLLDCNIGPLWIRKDHHSGIKAVFPYGNIRPLEVKTTNITWEHWQR